MAGAVGSLTLRIATSVPRMWKLGAADTLQRIATANFGQAIALGMGLAGFSACYNVSSPLLYSTEAHQSPTLRLASTAG